jgi:SAM-dependent methyltransferase
VAQQSEGRNPPSAPALKGSRTQAEANRQYFREAYRTGEHGWEQSEASPHVLRLLRRVHEAVPGERLLDLGCGEGRHCLIAARLGFETVGVDYEPLAVERARRLASSAGQGEIAFCVGDALSLPFAVASFDVVVDYGCLHHQRKADWPTYKANLLRVLRPRGFYVLSVFSPRFRLFRGSSRRWHLAHGAYRRCFTREEMVRLWESDFSFLDLVEERGKDRGMWHALLQRRALATKDEKP